MTVRITGILVQGVTSPAGQTVSITNPATDAVIGTVVSDGTTGIFSYSAPFMLSMMARAVSSSAAAANATVSAVAPPSAALAAACVTRAVVAGDATVTTGGGGVTVSDNFTSTGYLGAPNWEAEIGGAYSAPYANGSVATVIDEGAFGAAKWVGATKPSATGNVWVQCTVNGGFSGPRARIDPAGTTDYTFYGCQWDPTGQHLQVTRYSAGAGGMAAQSTGTFGACPPYLRLEVVGSTVKGYYRNAPGDAWTLFASYTDPSPIASGAVGFGVADGVSVDGWSAGDL
jgi:hypothetical protein